LTHALHFFKNEFSGSKLPLKGAQDVVSLLILAILSALAHQHRVNSLLATMATEGEAVPHSLVHSLTYLWQ
jgi:hypothetical protein